MRSRSAIVISATVSFVTAFVLYLRTLAPTVAFIDSGELTLAAAKLGVPHPPGAPLWVMLTHLFTRLPMGSVAWRANLASAFYAAIAAALIAICIAQLRRNDEKPVIVLVASLFGGLSLAFSKTVWAYATVTEVYTLNLALALAVIAALLQWRRTSVNRWLYIAAGLFGAAMGVHVVTAVVMLPAIGLLYFATAARTPPDQPPRTAAFRCFGIAVLVMIAVYVYEPIASARKPPIDWGGTSELSAFIDHVTAKQYRRAVSAPTDESLSLGGFVWSQLTRDLGPAWLALLLPLAGAVVLWMDDRVLFGFVALLIAANVAYVLNVAIGAQSGIGDDLDAYLMPSILSFVILAAIAVSAAMRNYGAVGALALLVPVIACVTAYPIRDRSEYWLAKRYAENTLRPVKPHGLILGNNWNFISPFHYYLQPVENMRPDVEVVTIGMLPWKWYRDELGRRHPDLMQAVRPQLEAFEPWATRWVEAKNDAEWLAQPDWHEEYVRTYNELILAMANSRLSQGRGVYATRDFLVTDQGALLYRAVHALETQYEIVPRGLVGEYAVRGTVPLAPLQLDLAGLTDGDQEDLTMQRVVEMYVRMYRLHGRYSYSKRRPDLAEASYREAMRLKPGDESIAREQATFAASVR